MSVSKIARSAGVSPGNLYYWFADKSEIVHALFDQWIVEALPAAPPSDPEELLALLWGGEVTMQEATPGYRTFIRELFWLLDSDAELAARYRDNYRTRVELIAAQARA